MARNDHRPSEPSFFDRPRAGLVLSFLVTACGSCYYLVSSLSRLEKDSQARDLGATRLIEARNRENDELSRRIGALEAAARNCKP